jgi:octopine/nopaline transport system permease protein
MELLAFGNTGWGDELFYATLMTIAVSITAMLIGFLFALIFTPLKLSKYKILILLEIFTQQLLEAFLSFL